jgi:3D (Asp-Asp-Asp) domain-containing protein
VRRPLVLAAAAAAAALLIVPAAAPGGSPSASDLRRKEADLAAQARSALLGLYALDSQLDAAHARLAGIRSREAELRGERASARLQLAVAVRALRISRRQLAQRLRTLYEQDEIDPLAIVLGAGSVEEAMTGLDGLGHLATQNRSVIAQTEQARRRLVALSASLDVRRAELRRLESAAAATAGSLEQARGERLAYVAQLGSEQRLTAQQIAVLDVRARAAEATSATATFESGSPPVTPPALRDTAAAGGGRTLVVLATGYSMTGRTSTGLPVGYGVAAVDPGLIPLGTRLTVPGYGDAVAADTGGAVRGPTIDLWFPSIPQALAWGRRTVTIAVH